MLGFKTIGNATLVCYDDDGPMLVTDPWIVGSVYFGSWGPMHEIPPDLYNDIMRAPFIFLSHGHPDHSPHESVERLKHKDKTILLPAHVGGRMEKDLRALGHQNVVVLPDFKWVRISENISVCSVCDYYQDAILLVNYRNQMLVCNINDAGDRGWWDFVKGVVDEFPMSVLLKLFCYGDVDMIAFSDEDGNFIEPPAAKKEPIGAKIQDYAERLGVTHVVPFSAMHRHQRDDSMWCAQYSTPLADLTIGYAAKTIQLLPAYQEYDLDADLWRDIEPKPYPHVVYPSEYFGDCWDERLTNGEAVKLQAYFQRFAHLSTFLSFIEFQVGGHSHGIQLGTGHHRGLRFAVPRASLMQCVDQEIFDDILIANFMTTQLVGKWEPRKLYPDFTPFVGKYGDNGRAHGDFDLELYFREYKRRNVEGFVKHAMVSPVNRIRKIALEDSFGIQKEGTAAP